jgi:hypothetical protein
MLPSKFFAVPVLWLVAVVPGAASPVVAQDSLRFEYAVKVICGAPDRPAVAPGRYYTAINVHNPSTRGIAFRKKFALTGPGEISLPVSGFSNNKLRPDYALEVDCTSRQLLDRKFAKGFAVIQSPVELDVVAVYTVGATRPETAADSIRAMDLERVPFRAMIPVPWP